MQVLLKKILIYLIAISLLSSHSYATPKINLSNSNSRLKNRNLNFNKENLGKIGQNYAHKMMPMRGLFRNAVASSTKSSGRVIGHQVQTILFIAILTAMEITKDKMRLDGIKNGTVFTDDLVHTVSDIPSVILETSGDLVNNTEFWSSVMGALTANLAGNIPLLPVSRIMADLLGSVTSRAALKNVIAIGVHTNVTFLGWEMAAELMSVAIQALPTEVDQERARRVSTFKFLLSANESDPEAVENRRVAKKVLENVKTIVWNDPVMRDLWLSNTWRNRIVSGHFVTLVSTMIAGASISKHFKFGKGYAFLTTLFAGAAWVAIPDSWEHQITHTLDSIRRSWWKMGDDRGSSGAFSVKEGIIRILYECSSEGRDCPPMLEFNPRYLGSNNYVSILFEEFIDFEKKINMHQASVDLALENENEDAHLKYTDRLNNTVIKYIERLDKLEEHFLAEANDMTRILGMYPLDEDWVEDYSRLEQVFMHNSLVQVNALFFSAFRRLIEAQLYNAPQDKNYLELMFKIHFFGFDEVNFVDALIASKMFQ